MEKSLDGGSHLKDLRRKIEFMLDLRDANLKENPNFVSLLKENISSGLLSQSDWDNTASNIPDLDALTIARRKLDEQFPKSTQEAILQAQDPFIRQALTAKLKDKITREIEITSSEIRSFLSECEKENSLDVSYLTKYKKPETAALKLKKDHYLDQWLDDQKKR